MFQPVIKWTGSKRSQSKLIVDKFPQKINTYYEPFCGGCSVLRQLIDNGNEVGEYICSDINQDLISLWIEIKNNPDIIKIHYEKLWNQLVELPTWEDKSKFYYDVRERFNSERSSLDFMFIMRTAVNGMPRYNRKGEFNTSFHLNRNGIVPSSLSKIIDEWSYLLNYYNVKFLCQDFRKLQSDKNDVVYVDPPYFNTDPMYFGEINLEELWNWLRLQKGKFFFSFNGKSNNEDKTFSIPEDIYSHHEYLPSGLSHFRSTVNGKSNDTFVYESLYTN